MSRTVCDSERITIKDNGLMKRIPLHSYVVLFTEKEDSDVMAIRYDGFENQYTVREMALRKYGAHWNIKEIRKLYDSDFDA